MYICNMFFKKNMFNFYIFTRSKTFTFFNRKYDQLFHVIKKAEKSTSFLNEVEAAVTDLRYFARNKFSKCLVDKKNFDLIWHVVFKLRYLFCQGRLETSFEFVRIRKAAILLSEFLNKSQSNCYWLIVFGKYFSLIKTYSTFYDFFNFWSSFD